MSNRYENLKRLDDAAFRRITGTKRCVFDKMLIIVHFFSFSATQTRRRTQ
ncbi:MAG: hypothetical protein LBT46_11845 [Planctomycetaceae bacterium]|nr:hypothetical protein [Planctomycetaceae bacterium]